MLLFHLPTVTSGKKKELEEQVVKVIVFASKIKNSTNHHHHQEKMSITALSKAEKHQCHWFKDRNKASFITKRHNPLFDWVLQLDNSYRHTFQGVFFGFW